MVGHLHRLLRSDRRVVAVRRQQTGGRHPEDHRQETAVVLHVQLVHDHPAAANGKPVPWPDGTTDLRLRFWFLHVFSSVWGVHLNPCSRVQSNKINAFIRTRSFFFFSKNMFTFVEQNKCVCWVPFDLFVITSLLFYGRIRGLAR